MSEEAPKDHDEYLPDDGPLAVSGAPQTQHKSKGSDTIKTALMVEAQFYGPLPPPAILEHYNRIEPSAADRIIRMAEEQSAHRRKMEETVAGAEVFAQRVGPLLGFILAMTAVSGGIWLISKGLTTEGLVAVIGALAAPVGVFVYGKHQQQKELERESQQRLPKNSSKNRRKRK